MFITFFYVCISRVQCVSDQDVSDDHPMKYMFIYQSFLNTCDRRISIMIYWRFTFDCRTSNILFVFLFETCFKLIMKKIKSWSLTRWKKKLFNINIYAEVNVLDGLYRLYPITKRNRNEKKKKIVNESLPRMWFFSSVWKENGSRLAEEIFHSLDFYSYRLRRDDVKHLCFTRYFNLIIWFFQYQNDCIMYDHISKKKRCDRVYYSLLDVIVLR